MHNSTYVLVVGGLALVATTASEVLCGIIAFGSATDTNLLLSLRVLLFVAFGLTIIGVISITYFTALFLPSLNRGRLILKRSIWTIYAVGIGVAIITLGLTGVALIWALYQQRSLPQLILYQHPSIWLYISVGIWGVSSLLQAALFLTVGVWTRRTIADVHNPSQGLDFGLKNRADLRVMTDRGRSLGSRDTTLASVPRSPSTNAASSVRCPSSTKTLTAATSRTKLIGRHSARSSMEHPVPPVGEVLTLDAFEQWDTSSVHHEIRAAVGPSPVTTKSTKGLETIPGSRPDSPTNPLDHPFEPFPSPHQLISSETNTTYEQSSPVSHHKTSYIIASSPPSSPPNFSRPTSKSRIRSFAASTDMTREQHVHPLFRSTSPLPPPIATLNTTVTVSNANEPITPKSLARLRNSSVQERGLRQFMTPTAKGHWRAMPSVDASSTRPSTAGSMVLGSPGPSIADEEELPPIIPGFVLGAGTRTSFIGYSSRKLSKKEKRSSRLSFTE